MTTHALRLRIDLGDPSLGAVRIDSAGLQALEDLAGTLKDDGIALHFARRVRVHGHRARTWQLG